MKQNKNQACTTTFKVGVAIRASPVGLAHRSAKKMRGRSG